MKSMTETPKPRRRKTKEKSEGIKTETVGADKTEAYLASEPKQYTPPENMVALNDDRYIKKDRVGKQKTVRGPGSPVTRVGLGGLKTITQNATDYHGNLDV